MLCTVLRYAAGLCAFWKKRPQNVQGRIGRLVGSNLVNHRQTSELWNIHGKNREGEKKKERKSNEGQHETVDGVAKEKKK